MRLFRKTFLILWVIFACSLLCLQVSAEFFKYVDPYGVTHYVDDLSKIPVEHQGAWKSYREKYDHLPEEEKRMRLEQDRQAAQKREETENTQAPGDFPGEALEDNRPEQQPVPVAEAAALETQVVIRGNHVLVPVFLGYGGYETKTLLLLDTGATLVSLHQDLADRIKLVPVRTARAQMADGKTVPYKLAELDFMIVGPHKIENVMVGIYKPSGPQAGFSGLLGMNVMKNLEYTIDFSRQIIKWKP